MSAVGAYEAKTHLSRLLERVARGECITITRHGVPVARLVPVSMEARREPRDVVGEILEFRKGRRRGRLSIRRMIEDGRRH